MVFEYALPWWALVLVLACAALLAAASYLRTAAPLTRRQQASLWALRLASLLLIVAFLLRPMIIEPSKAGRDVVVPVLVDASRSMRLADAGGASRIERARSLVERELLPGLKDDFRVELLTFGETLAPAESSRLQATGRWSDLSGALGDVADRYRGRAVAGIVVISDGGETSGRDAAASIEAPGPPVFTVGIGSRRIDRDREVMSVTAGRAALADSAIEVGATVVSHGFGTAPIELRLLENGRPVQVRRAAVSADGSPVRETFRASPRTGGATLYTVEIPTDARELAPENNSRSVLVRPPGPRRRILLVEGAPGFEHSFLKRALGLDSGLEIDAVVRKGQNDRGEDTYYVQAASARTSALARGYPTDREALYAYDALVLGNVEGDAFTRDQLSMTADFVSVRGGGLLVLGASSFAGRGLIGTPLEEVLPVELGGRGGLVRASVRALEPNKIELTPDGAAHPVMQIAGSSGDVEERWANVPSLASVVPLGGPRPGATILALTAGPGGVEPVVAVQPYGRGRAMVFAGEASWRWKMLLPATDHVYDTFWRQVIRWLSTSAPPQVTVVPTGGSVAGEPMRLDVAVRNRRFEPVGDAQVDVTVTGPDRVARTLTAGLSDAGAGGYQARFQPDQPGVYRVRVQARQAEGVMSAVEDWVLVGGADAEMSDPRLNDEVLRRLAIATGGRFLTEGDLGRLSALLRTEAPEALPEVRRDLWHNVWTFLILASLLSAEWTLRRRWGLR